MFILMATNWLPVLNLGSGHSISKSGNSKGPAGGNNSDLPWLLNMPPIREIAVQLLFTV